MPNSGENSSTRTVDAVGRTIDIFEALHELEGGTVTELADHLGYSKSSVHAYLTSLEEREFVTKEGYFYRPSYRFITIAERLRRSHYDIYRFGREAAKRLAEETGEFVQIMVEEYEMGIHIFTASGKKGVYADKYPVGRPCPLHCNAAGKAILATLPERKLQRIVFQNNLPAITENTITDPDELLRELEAIQETGVAFSTEEAVIGMRGIASPVVGPSGEPLGSVNISGPVSQFDKERFRETLPEKVVECSNFIEVEVMNERGYDD
ncbi:IclR family transcriptional regulator [Halobacterium wangiae]|uniref:IclR family transcriptional regulator n=1 Tax=Halobacterium wangiae TaxID=2902623 RepID=UPI001E28F7BA|nr:IclR family transcriptional regulator [Halobacterium wangiae]